MWRPRAPSGRADTDTGNSRDLFSNAIQPRAEHRTHLRQVAEVQLVLQRLGAGGDDHPLARAAAPAPGTRRPRQSACRARRSSAAPRAPSMLGESRRGTRQFARERASGTKQGADVVGLGVIEVGHPPSPGGAERATRNRNRNLGRRRRHPLDTGAPPAKENRCQTAPRALAPALDLVDIHGQPIMTSSRGRLTLLSFFRRGAACPLQFPHLRADQPRCELAARGLDIIAVFAVLAGSGVRHGSRAGRWPPIPPRTHARSTASSVRSGAS